MMTQRMRQWRFSIKRRGQKIISYKVGGVGRGVQQDMRGEGVHPYLSKSKYSNTMDVFYSGRINNAYSQENDQFHVSFLSVFSPILGSRGAIKTQ